MHPSGESWCWTCLGNALDIQRVYEVLAPRVPSLLKLRGTDCHTEVFRLIFEH
jgi:hypothetical protein